MAPLNATKKYTKEEKLQKVIAILNEVGLDEKYLEKYPHEMSGGQRQRVVIARALINDPELVVCDEPVSALDVSVRSQVLNLLKDLQKSRNLTYIFISHDLSVVEYLCDKVAVMYLGRIMEYADKKHLFGNPLHPYTKALLSAIPVPDIHAVKDEIILEGEVPSPLNPPKGCLFSTRCPYATDKCRTEAPKLQEITDKDGTNGVWPASCTIKRRETVCITSISWIIRTFAMSMIWITAERRRKSVRLRLRPAALAAFA